MFVFSFIQSGIFFLHLYKRQVFPPPSKKEEERRKKSRVTSHIRIRDVLYVCASLPHLSQFLYRFKLQKIPTTISIISPPLQIIFFLYLSLSLRACNCDTMVTSLMMNFFFGPSIFFSCLRACAFLPSPLLDEKKSMACDGFGSKNGYHTRLFFMSHKRKWCLCRYLY